MKKDYTIDDKKLARFTALAGAVIASSSVNAQIIYTDVNPDAIIDLSTGPYDVDFNNDLSSDLNLQIQHLSGSGSMSGFSYTYTGSAAVAIPGSGGGLLQVATGTSSSAAMLPGALNAGVAVNVGGSFGSAGPLGINALVNIPALGITYPYLVGEWLGSTDKFLGVKFLAAGNTHYGWARLDVTAAGDTIVLKDYAYNALAGDSIMTGQMLGLEGISVNDKVTIRTTLTEAMINVTPDLIGGTIAVMSASGQTVKEVKIEDVNTTVPFEGIETGIYFVSAQFNDGSVNKKIYVK